jgi:lysyl-tRNA synthetase class 2
LSDVESRVRQRYVDLIVNPETRRMAELKSAVIRSIREELHARGFLEVETPVLQPVHGGANARPFISHINAYDMDIYLRIALELHLKRLVVGGVEKVFEIGRIFRNEGVDSTHNPEFTMLEAYEAYGDYNTIGTLTRELIQAAAVAGLGSTVLRRAGGGEYDIGGDWPSKTVHGAVSEALGEEVTPDTSEERLRKLCLQAGVPTEPGWDAGHIVLEMYERLVERQTVEPTFYRDFPVEVSPLTRAHREDPRLAERWDLVAFGTELGTGYSELIDPVEERARLTAQSLLAAGGDPEAMQLDEDFLRALEYGMPPSGGMGAGIDRILIMMTGESIRETILFPMVRPE